MDSEAWRFFGPPSRLAADLTRRIGRGPSRQNLHKYRQFFLSHLEIRPTVSGESDYLTAHQKEKMLANEIEKTRKRLDTGGGGA
jgi:hypothetical protein